MNREVTLGKKYRDVVTGFEGIATAKFEFLNGCIRVAMTPQELKDGKPIEAQTFDVEQLQKIDGGVDLTKSNTGGPGSSTPAPRSEPKR